ncbi:hypothetical protein [Caulobacter sp. UNC358MFTsu5.1]|uniref:hypothetical protein n=1 Tax=Caulobacter sp. UNC358MFTsu5.1 TaxID=1449049 RepID=UPI0004A6AA95|nr:hypothetical protein [Caulobacter sp. UNC358MFTsu5.1]
MFEITGEDVARLSDADLRTLVARLCLAELRAQGAQLSAVTAGGAQDAPDGGLDVRVELAVGLARHDFVPRAKTGFQVKRPDMPRGKILAEMRAGDHLRPVISDLAASDGAYVIVSAQGSVADGPLADRRRAMRDAIADDPNQARLHTDFYDRERVATWCNEYVGAAAFVRARTGHELAGWRSIGRWSDTGVAVDGGYLVSDFACLIDERQDRRERLMVLDGIARLRSSLGQPGHCVRLIGLSGLGKTRLAEALFEDGVGEAPLDPALAVYTDYSSETTPSAVDMALRLVAADRRAILIVDNCNPATHAQVARICGEDGSQVSLLTIEYDVRDDEPEDTDVFRLAAVSPELVETWLERTFPSMPQVNRSRIAEFSNGNFRVARALASTLRGGESLGQLRDQDLFERIFQQRNVADRSLLRDAEALSLVYSFNGEDLADGGELAALAGSAGRSLRDLRESMSDLVDRGLVQSRGRWRAMLPQALANPLASSAIRRMLPSEIETFFDTAPPRLLLSFTRRLSYLHDSADARALVERWLSPGGRFHRLPTDDDFVLVQNLAPVAPDLVLARMAEHLAGPDVGEILRPNNIHRRPWIDLLKSLAFEVAHFDQAACCLAMFVAAEVEPSRHSSAKDAFRELFQLYLSGTRAEPAQRRRLIRAMLEDSEAPLGVAGREALSALFEIGHFSASSSFDFGARPRDFGWTPANNEEIRTWYNEAIALALDLLPVPQAKDFLEDNLRALWTQGASHDLLESVCQRLAADGGWNGAWLALRSALKFDGEGMPADVRERLERLIAALQPVGLLPRARAIVLMIGTGRFDLDEQDYDDEGELIASTPSAAEQARAIGAAMATDEAALAAFLPEVIVAQTPPRAFEFGEGLGGAVSDVPGAWARLEAGYGAVVADYKNPTVLGGYLNAALARDPGFVTGVLDGAATSQHLAPHLAYFQGVVGLDDGAFRRMTAALNSGMAQPNHYSRLSIRQLTPARVGELATFLEALNAYEDGAVVGVEILHGSLRRNPTLSEQTLASLTEVGRALLARVDFAPRGVMFDHALETLLVQCLPGAAPDVALAICERARATVAESRGSAFTPRKRILGRIFQAQPVLALNLFLLEPPSGLRMLFDYGVPNGSPVATLPAGVLCDWADIDPANRWPRLSRTLLLFEPRNVERQVNPSPLFMAVLQRAPDPAAFLGAYHSRLQPGSWGGSLAEILEGRRRAILKAGDPALTAWARAAEAEHVAWVQAERDREHRREESFE